MMHRPLNWLRQQELGCKGVVAVEIKKLIHEAHETAYGNGFWDMERQVLNKMLSMGFTDDEVKAVKQAFEMQKMLLIVSEIGEYVEAVREGKVREGDEELVDILIRWADFVKGTGADGRVTDTLLRKMRKNKERPRLHGKEF